MKPGQLSDDERIAERYMRENFPETFGEWLLLKFKRVRNNKKW